MSMGRYQLVGCVVVCERCSELMRDFVVHHVGMGCCTCQSKHVMKFLPCSGDGHRVSVLEGYPYDAISIIMVSHEYVFVALTRFTRKSSSEIGVCNGHAIMIYDHVCDIASCDIG